MQINFTGIKNIGYETRQTRSIYYDDGTCEFLCPDDDMSKEDYDEDIYDHYITVQLTDDYNGKDLTEFRNKIKNTKFAEYLHPENPDLLSFSISKTDFTDEFVTKPEVEFYINDCADELEVKDENLALFSYFGKLLKRISQMKDSEFIVNKNYIETDASTSIIIGDDLREDYGEHYEQIMKQVHSPEVVRNGAKEMDKILVDRMLDYFS